MRVLVIGLGSMGRKRVPILLEQGAQVVGTDLREDRREYARREYGIDTYATFEEALQTGPDALVICNMPNEHLPYVKFGLENGYHTFSEENCVNPGQMGEFDEIISLSRKHPELVAAPSCTMRYHPCIQRIKELVDSGVLGERRNSFITYHCGSYLPDWHTYESVRDYYAGRRENGGGRDMVPFEYDWLSWIFGEVTSLSALTQKLGTFDADIFDTYQLLNTFEEGNTAVVVVDVLLRWSSRYFRYVTEKGEINWDYNAHFLNVYYAEENRWEHIPEAPISGPYKGWNQMDMYRDEIRHFLAAVRGECRYQMDYEEEKRLNQLALAAEESARSGRRVSL